MSEQTNKTHPILIIAAISVIILSAAGVGAIMGWIPTSTSKTSEQAATQSAEKPADKLADAQTKSDTPAAAEKETAAKTEEKKPAHVEKTEKHSQKTARNDSYRESATSSASPTKPAATCSNCGVVSSINAIEQPGEGTGLGAIAGGVAGALIGSQIGQGQGTTVATIAGAAGGAYAGHQVEKNVKKTKHVEINVRMDDGTYKTFSQPNEAGLMVGDKVKIVDGTIVRN